VSETPTATAGPPPPPNHDLDDDTLLERARSARNGDKFRRLYDEGNIDGYGSRSEADLALVGEIAFWTGPDPDRIDRLFRGSKLMRDKWDRDDYRERTIEKALANCTEFYGSSSQEADPEDDVDTEDGGHRGGRASQSTDLVRLATERYA
jgi:primase-polymerase (primpol)-like protein